jgi:SDR family mycofactocin-dependent oxidoreductase
MSGRVEGKVAFITGAARGQGRSHAIRLAQQGADIIAVDVCEDIGTTPYALARAEDLAITVKEVEALGRRIVATRADVRDFDALKQAVDNAVSQLGRLDIVCANAGIASQAPAHEMSESTWQTMIDVNLTGVWHTCKASIPHLKAGGRGGCIILTSSAAGLRGYLNISHYVTAKHGIVGLMRTLALELASDSIRVNSVHPGNVDTPLLHNEEIYRAFLPDSVEVPTREEFAVASSSIFSMPIPWVEAVDVSNAVLYLASDEARYVTGVALPVDGGVSIK